MHGTRLGVRREAQRHAAFGGDCRRAPTWTFARAPLPRAPVAKAVSRFACHRTPRRRCAFMRLFHSERWHESKRMSRKAARAWREPLDCGGLTPLFLRTVEGVLHARGAVLQNCVRLPPSSRSSGELRYFLWRASFAWKAKAASSRRTPKPRGTQAPFGRRHHGIAGLAFNHVPLAWPIGLAVVVGSGVP